MLLISLLLKRMKCFIIYVFIFLSPIRKNLLLCLSWKTLKKTLFFEKPLSLLKRENSCILLTNNFLHAEREKDVDHPRSIKLILNNWASSHSNVTRIINDQFPDQYENILGGDIKDGIPLTNKVDTKQTFYNTDSFAKDFKTTFLVLVTQIKLDNHCTFDWNGNTKCISCLSDLGPSLRPYNHEYVFPTTKILLKFPIANGEVDGFWAF